MQAQVPVGVATQVVNHSVKHKQCTAEWGRIFPVPGLPRTIGKRFQSGRDSSKVMFVAGNSSCGLHNLFKISEKDE